MTHPQTISSSQKGLVLWLTGLPGSGKTTLAQALQKKVRLATGYVSVILDGDELRKEISKDLGFTPQSREKHIERVIALCALLQQQLPLIIVAVISPYVRMRKKARDRLGEETFFEIYIQAPLDVCMERDPKGHYLQATQNQKRLFTGISAPYEIPPFPSLVIDTTASLDDCLQRLWDFVREKISASEHCLNLSS